MNLNAKLVSLVVASSLPMTFLCAPSGAQVQPPAKPALAPTPQDSPFANLPKDSWVYPAFSILIEHHVLSATANGEGGCFPFWRIGDPFTRYEAAVWLARGIDIGIREEAETKKNPNYRKTLKSIDDIALLERLTTELNVELKTLGMDVAFVLRKFDGMEQEVRAAEPPFPDVAPTHWASNSVERLRVTGILVGYPGGTFLAKRD